MNRVNPGSSEPNFSPNSELPALSDQDRRVQSSILGLTPSGAPFVEAPAPRISRIPSPGIATPVLEPESYPLAGRAIYSSTFSGYGVEEFKGPPVPFDSDLGSSVWEDEESNEAGFVPGFVPGFVKGLDAVWEAELASMGFTNDNRIGFRSQKESSVIQGFHLFRDVEDLPNGETKLVLSLQIKFRNQPQFLEIFDGLIDLNEVSGNAYLTGHFEAIGVIWSILKENTQIFNHAGINLSPEDIAEVDEFIGNSDAADSEPDIMFYPSPEPVLPPSNFQYVPCPGPSYGGVDIELEGFDIVAPPERSDTPDITEYDDDEAKMLEAAIALSLQEK